MSHIKWVSSLFRKAKTTLSYSAQSEIDDPVSWNYLHFKNGSHQTWAMRSCVRRQSASTACTDASGPIPSERNEGRTEASLYCLCQMRPSHFQVSIELVRPRRHNIRGLTARPRLRWSTGADIFLTLRESSVEPYPFLSTKAPPHSECMQQKTKKSSKVHQPLLVAVMKISVHVTLAQSSSGILFVVPSR